MSEADGIIILTFRQIEWYGAHGHAPHNHAHNCTHTLTHTAPPRSPSKQPA